MGTFNDIDASFTIDARGSLNMVENAQAIRQSIRNILFTRIGLRPGTGMDRFGTPIEKYSFAPLTQYAAQRLGEEILQALEGYEPRITILSVEPTIDMDESRFDVSIFYRINSAKGQVEEFRTIITQL